MVRIPLIVGDFGPEPLRPPADEDFHELVAERYEQTRLHYVDKWQFRSTPALECARAKRVRPGLQPTPRLRPEAGARFSGHFVPRLRGKFVVDRAKVTESQPSAMVIAFGGLAGGGLKVK